MPSKPAPPLALLQEAALGQLIAAGASSGVTARGSSKGFEIHIQMGESQGVLVSSRNLPRRFASLSTVVTLLGRLGCKVFAVDTTAYKPGLIRPAQPERSKAMKAGKLPKAASKTAKCPSPKSRTA